MADPSLALPLLHRVAMGHRVRRHGLGAIDLVVGISLVGVLLGLFRAGQLTVRADLRHVQWRLRALLLAQDCMELVAANEALISATRERIRLIQRDSLEAFLDVQRQDEGMRRLVVTVRWRESIAGSIHEERLMRLTADQRSFWVRQ